VTAVPQELVPAGPPANAVSEVAQLPPQTEEESHVFVENVWRFFCSLRLTLANLLLLFLRQPAERHAREHRAIWGQAVAGRIAPGGASHRNAEAFSHEFTRLRAEFAL
jgi:hypothetical protein